MLAFSVVALQAFLGLSLPVRGGEASAELTFMFITSFGQFGQNSSGAIPAATMALRDINNRSDLLPGYTLRYEEIRDSQCHRTHALDSFFDGIQSDPVKIAVIGCGCSVATIPVAEISHRWNITQLSYTSGSSSLSDRSRFKRYFRNSPTVEIVAPALHSTLNHFKWTRIALLTQNEGVFTGVETSYREEFEPSGITVASTVFQTTDEDPVSSSTDFFLQREDYRVFVLNCYSTVARDIACEAIPRVQWLDDLVNPNETSKSLFNGCSLQALKRGLTYPRYAWITFDWYPQRWWTQEVSKNTVDCSDNDLAEFVETMISIRRYPEPDNFDDITDAGITAMEFQEEYEMMATEGEYEVTDFAVRFYDILWILALALNNTMTTINTRDISGTGCENITGELVPLEEFNYTNEKIGCIIQYHLQLTDFTGGSGQIMFDESGTRIHHRVRLKQYRFDDKQNLVRKRIAYIDRTDNYTFNYEPGIDDSYVYSDGIPPDGKSKEVIHTYKTGLVVFIDILATFGIIFALVCLVFNVVFRNTRVVKISSPSLNYFIIAGAFLMYAAMYVHLIPTTDEGGFEAHCLLKDWLFTVGYALCYGTVLAKMYRVYYIFQNPTAKKTALYDWHLMLIALGVTGVAVFLVLLQSSIPELRGDVQLETDDEDPEGETSLGVPVEYYVWVCYETSTAASYWQIFVFAYLVMLQIVGIVLAFQTRKVKVRALRDSKFIAAIIYISSLVLLVLGVSTFALRTYINARGAVFACGIFILTTIFLALIFIPKMILLYRDPEGKTIFEDTTTKSQATENSDAYLDMKTRLALKEKELQEKDQVINGLKSELQELQAATCTEENLEV